MRKVRPTRAGNRRAMFVVIVLVCLVLVMLLASLVTKAILRERLHLRRQADRLQAEYLAESALYRAAAQLDRDANYRGETWQIDAATLATRAGAKVVIAVEPSSGEPAARLIKVVADFPDSATPRVRHSKELKIVLSQ